MVPAKQPDPVAALREFVDRVSPYDPDPSASPGGTIQLRYGHAADTITLSPHVAHAIQEALARYRDPADRGHCAGCGGRQLDDSLRCQDCGLMHGVFGAVVGDWMERFQRSTEGPAG